jgi:hypothetical protein
VSKAQRRLFCDGRVDRSVMVEVSSVASSGPQDTDVVGLITAATPSRFARVGSARSPRVLHIRWRDILIRRASSSSVGVQLAPDHVPPEWPDGMCRRVGYRWRGRLVRRHAAPTGGCYVRRVRPVRIAPARCARSSSDADRRRSSSMSRRGARSPQTAAVRPA